MGVYFVHEAALFARLNLSSSCPVAVRRGGLESVAARVARSGSSYFVREAPWVGYGACVRAEPCTSYTKHRGLGTGHASKPNRVLRTRSTVGLVRGLRSSPSYFVHEAPTFVQ